MVKTSSIQAYLRQHLYGIANLPVPERYRFKRSDQDQIRVATAKQAAEALTRMQRRLEHGTYTAVRDRPMRLPMSTLEDVRGDRMLLSQDFGWPVTTDPNISRWVVRDSSMSVLTLCSEDKLVIESRW
jgi:hypothetical protein